MVGSVHFVEDNLHLPGEKKKTKPKISAGEEKVIGSRQSRDGAYIGARTSLQMGMVWVITKLPTTDPVKKNDLQSCLCLLGYWLSWFGVSLKPFSSKGGDPGCFDKLASFFSGARRKG